MPSGFPPAGTVIASQKHAASVAGGAADASRESLIRPQTNEGENRGYAPKAFSLLPMVVTPHETTEAPAGMATGEADIGEDTEMMRDFQEQRRCR